MQCQRIFYSLCVCALYGVGSGCFLSDSSLGVWMDGWMDGRMEYGIHAVQHIRLDVDHALCPCYSRGEHVRVSEWVGAWGWNDDNSLAMMMTFLFLFLGTE